MNNDLREAMSFDALATAEKITKKSYKGGDLTAMIGMVLLQQNSAKKRQLLQEIGDTHTGMLFKDYVNVVESFGFVKVYDEDFEDDRDKHVRHCHIYFNELRGIILYINSFYENINKSMFFYNQLMKFEDNMHISSGHSSGRYMSYGRKGIQFYSDNICPVNYPFPYPDRKNLNFNDHMKNIDTWHIKRDGFARSRGLSVVWSGYNDGRDGLISQILDIESAGSFIPMWVDDNMLSTLQIYLHDHNSGEKWEDENSVGANRLKSLPKNVKNVINYKG